MGFKRKTRENRGSSRENMSFLHVFSLQPIEGMFEQTYAKKCIEMFGLAIGF